MDLLEMAGPTVIAGGAGPEFLYATWDPVNSSGGVFSNGNLTAQLFQGGGVARSTIGKTSGKWYWEVSIPDVFSSVGMGSNPSDYTYNFSRGVAWRGGFSLTTYKDGIGIDTTLGSFAGNVMGCALDLDNLLFYFYRNGVLASEATINPVSVTPGFTYYALASRSGPGVGSNFYTANFGASAFAFAPPSGFNAGLYDIL